MKRAPVIIMMRNVPGDAEKRALTEPLKCMMWDGSYDYIPTNFKWDGSSVPWILRGLFPKHKHPVSSCKHDYRCGKAENKKQRKWNDSKFQEDINRTPGKVAYVESKMGWLGVRIGSFFGVGNNF